MNKQFTASEVRDWERAYKGTGAAKVFGAFADLLEAQEKAVPVMVVNHVSSAEHDLPIGMKLYAHPTPADTERLAEALRNGLIDALRHQRQIDEDGAEVGVSRQAIDEAAAILSALAAHSAQAQPPAASVTDAMIMRAVKAWTSNGFGSPGQVFSIYRVAKAMLEAALAAQENPNG